ncbi:MAG: hypothetical protein MJZ03_04885 [archaeon]|nr:hypothetical protein [archaeon]
MSEANVLPKAIASVYNYYVAMSKKYEFDEDKIVLYVNRIRSIAKDINENTIFRKPQVKKYADAGYIEFFYIPRPRKNGRTSWYFECKKDEHGTIVIHEIVPSAMMHDSWYIQMAVSFLNE